MSERVRDLIADLGEPKRRGPALDGLRGMSDQMLTMEPEYLVALPAALAALPPRIRISLLELVPAVMRLTTDPVVLDPIFSRVRWAGGLDGARLRLMRAVMTDAAVPALRSILSARPDDTAALWVLWQMVRYPPQSKDAYDALFDAVDRADGAARAALMKIIGSPRTACGADRLTGRLADLLARDLPAMARSHAHQAVGLMSLLSVSDEAVFERTVDAAGWSTSIAMAYAGGPVGRSWLSRQRPPGDTIIPGLGDAPCIESHPAVAAELLGAATCRCRRAATLPDTSSASTGCGRGWANASCPARAPRAPLAAR